MSNYYIYEWYNVDTGEVLYVGKGKNNRLNVKHGRSNHFLNYINKHECDVRKTHENLEEDEAYEIEVERISYYKGIGQAFCNYSDGGEGNTGLIHSKETRARLSETHIGELNSQYGVSPQDRMSKEVFEAWKEKLRIAKGGENNPKAKFTEKDVLTIRKLYEDGMSVMEIVKLYYPEVAEDYKLRKRKWSTINHIVKRHTWKNI